MHKQEILSHIDHTLIRPDSTWEEIEALCEEAVKKQTANVCIPPTYIERVHEAYPDLTICAAVGFPLGYSTSEVKAFEAADYIKKGAREIDMVIDIGALKDGDLDKVAADIKAVREATDGNILKVIVETCYLTEEEKRAVSEIVRDSGADYIKTSTGFGADGAKPEDVKLFKSVLGEDVKIKAAGGIRTKEEILEFLSLGCDRIGTSRGVAALEDET